MSVVHTSQAGNALGAQFVAAGLGQAAKAPASVATARASVAQLRDISRPEIRDAARGLTEADAVGFARALLRALGRNDHPDLEDNPIFALYQVALDYRCSADGYRALFDQQRSKT